MYSTAICRTEEETITKARKGALPPATAWQDIKDTLIEERIARVATVKPGLVLVHMQNRGGLGVNPFNVHRNGAKIKSNGVVTEELEKAVVIEISPSPTVAAKQHAFNVDLILRSKGLLAPMNGSEIYLSLGSGHTIKFLSAQWVHAAALPSKPWQCFVP